MINLERVLVFDIETHRVQEWEEISDALKDAFATHYYDEKEYDSPMEQYRKMAALYPEFSRAICVVFGYWRMVDNQFVTYEVHGEDEVALLRECGRILESFKKQGYVLCGHNCNEFDIPFLARRYIINGMKVPKMINTLGLKPWEIDSIDIMAQWKFGSWRSTALDTMSAVLGISCKTDTVRGSNLAERAIGEMDWDQLVHYCTEDVTATWGVLERIVSCTQ